MDGHLKHALNEHMGNPEIIKAWRFYRAIENQLPAEEFTVAAKNQIFRFVQEPDQRVGSVIVYQPTHGMSVQEIARRSIEKENQSLINHLTEKWSKRKYDGSDDNGHARQTARDRIIAHTCEVLPREVLPGFILRHEVPTRGVPFRVASERMRAAFHASLRLAYGDDVEIVAPSHLHHAMIVIPRPGSSAEADLTAWSQAKSQTAKRAM